MKTTGQLIMNSIYEIKSWQSSTCSMIICWCGAKEDICSLLIYASVLKLPLTYGSSNLYCSKVFLLSFRINMNMNTSFQRIQPNHLRLSLSLRTNTANAAATFPLHLIVLPKQKASTSFPTSPLGRCGARSYKT